MDNLESVRKVFEKDRFASSTGCTIDEVSDGFARCTFNITPMHLNAAGTVMGGAIFTLADFAFAVASNWNKPLHVSLTSQITFLDAPKGSVLIAEAKMIKEGRTTCLYTVDIFDEENRKVAYVTVGGFIKTR